MRYTSAVSPDYDGKAPHLRISGGDVPGIVLMPGDPGRVAFFTSLCEDFGIISSNREYTVGKGTYKGTPVMVCSTGIGGPSTEIAVMELISLGAKALIRIGGTGVIRDDIEIGSMVINHAAVRQGGASVFYAPPEYPAAASFPVLDSLKTACEEHGISYTMGICASVGSFYAGQGRSYDNNGGFAVDSGLIDRYQRLGVVNFEMEAETIFTLASIYGVLSGSICVTHCNRISDKWLVDFESAQKKMCILALEGAVYLNKKYL